MKILVVGGTGFIGTLLIPSLKDNGQQISMVIPLGRKPQEIKADCAILKGDTANQQWWAELIEKHQVIINLTGSSIFRRWNKRVKEDIYETRIITTRNIVQALKACSSKEKHFFSASGVGYYGYQLNETLNEESGPGSSFLARVAVNLEAEALKAKEYCARVVLCRFGIVMGKNGGALKNMLPFFRCWCGGRWGSGRQWFSWMHAYDLTRAIHFLLEHGEIEGAVNFTAPNPVTNQEMARLLRMVLRKRTLLPVIPGFLMRYALGEFSEVFLKGQRALPRKLLSAGFQFRYPLLEGCLSDLLDVPPKLNS